LERITPHGKEKEKGKAEWRIEIEEKVERRKVEKGENGGGERRRKEEGWEEGERRRKEGGFRCFAEVDTFFVEGDEGRTWEVVVVATAGRDTPEEVRGEGRGRREEGGREEEGERRRQEKKKAS
jgi:hypothetical protein